MDWINLENKLIKKADVSALEFSPPEGPIIANLTIHLHGGSEIKLTRDEAVEVWEMFQNKAKAE